MAAPAAARASGSPAALRVALIVAAAAWLLLLIGLPFVSVFVQAFAKGWKLFAESLAREDFVNAARLSMLAAGVSVAVNTAFGIVAAWVIARSSFRGRTLLLSILDLPIAISPVIAGMMFVFLFGRTGWLGPWLQAHDIKIIFAAPGIVLVTCFVTLPFVVRELAPALEEEGREEEQAAETLGASPVRTFVHVILPNIKWALFYGVILTNARAMGEFGAVSVVSGHLINRTQTLPLHIERMYIEYETVAAFSAAVPLALLAGVTLIAQAVLARVLDRRKRASRKTGEVQGLAYEY